MIILQHRQYGAVTLALLNGNIYSQNDISFCSLFCYSNSCLNFFLLELPQVVNTRRDKGERSDSL